MPDARRGAGKDPDKPEGCVREISQEERIHSSCGKEGCADMIGAVIGDIAGSKYELHNHRSKRFEFLADDCFFTDDTVMTLAVCRALLETKDPSLLGGAAVRSMREIGRQYPHCGYGGAFRAWLFSDDPMPYGSWGNGAAMRVGGCGIAASSLPEAKSLSAAVTGVTHNHPEGLKGAEAVAAAVFLAKNGTPKKEIRALITEQYYPLEFTIGEIRETYCFSESCQGTVPEALEAFFESENFEDAVRTAVSVGGDSDTLAAITGGIAEAYYGVPETLRRRALSFLDERLARILFSFEDKYPPKIL